MMNNLMFELAPWKQQGATAAGRAHRSFRALLGAGLLVLAASLLAVNASTALGGEAVNINLASAEVLAEALTGVGMMAKAFRIVEYREAHGPFESIEELAEVKGIGAGTVEKIVTLFCCSKALGSGALC